MLDRRSPRGTDWLLAGLVFAFAWAVLVWAYPIAPANGDVLRDHLLARDCAELGQCRTMGANTSVPGTSFAAVWVDLIATIRVLGGDADTVRHVVLLLNALAVALFYFVVRVHLRRTIALPGALIVLSTLLVADMVSPFWNPSTVILPSVLCAAGLLLYAIDAELRYLVVASFAATLAFNLHPAAATLLPALLLVGMAGGPRPLRQGVLMLLVIAVTSLSLSWLAWLNQTKELYERHLLLPALLGVALHLAIGALAGVRFRQLTIGWRALWTGLLLVAPFLLGAMAMKLVLHRTPSLRYLPAILGPAVLLVLAPLGRVFTRATSLGASVAIGTCLLLVFAPGIRRAEGTRYTMNDAKEISRHLAERGWTYSSALFHTQGTLCHDLTGSVGLYLPPSADLPADNGRQLRVEFFSPPQQSRQTGEHIALEQGRSVVIEEVLSWLRPWSAQVCNDDRCEQANIAKSSTFASRWNPEARAQEAKAPSVVRWEIPLVPNAEPTHLFELIDLSPAGCRWRVTRVEGVTTTTPLPAERVVLTSPQGQPGKIVFEKEFDPSRCPVSFHEGAAPPCVFETRPGESPFTAGATPG